MPEPSTFSISRLNNDIYPLEYSLKIKYDINVLYFTVASVEDVYNLIRDKVNAYLYIFDVSHYMEKGGIYLTLKEILEMEKIEAECVYEDDIIVIKKEKFKKFLKFPQYNLRMFDHDRLLSNAEFYAFYKPAAERLKDLDVFLDAGNRLPGYFINCHDNSLLYCETRDIDLKAELLKKMLHDYFEAFLNKNHGIKPDISMPPQELVNDLFNKRGRLVIREKDTSLKNNRVEVLMLEDENRETGVLTYKLDRKEWETREQG